MFFTSGEAHLARAQDLRAGDKIGGEVCDRVELAHYDFKSDRIEHMHKGAARIDVADHERAKPIARGVDMCRAGERRDDHQRSARVREVAACRCFGTADHRDQMRDAVGFAWQRHRQRLGAMLVGEHPIGMEIEPAFGAIELRHRAVDRPPIPSRPGEFDRLVLLPADCLVAEQHDMVLEHREQIGDLLPAAARGLGAVVECVGVGPKSQECAVSELRQPLLRGRQPFAPNDRCHRRFITAGCRSSIPPGNRMSHLRSLDMLSIDDLVRFQMIKRRFATTDIGARSCPLAEHERRAAYWCVSPKAAIPVSTMITTRAAGPSTTTPHPFGDRADVKPLLACGQTPTPVRCSTPLPGNSTRSSSDPPAASTKRRRVDRYRSVCFSIL